MAGRIPTVIKIDPVSKTQVVTAQVRVPAIPREQMSDRQQNAAQQHTADATAAARTEPRSGRTIIQGVVFSETDTKTISHHLGRAYVGFTVSHVRAGKLALISISASATPNPDPTKFIKLDCNNVLIPGSGGVTVDLEVW